MMYLRLPHCQEAPPTVCPLCGAIAVLPLDDTTRAMQPDGTTHVCHPTLEGCSAGYVLAPLAATILARWAR